MPSFRSCRKCNSLTLRVGVASTWTLFKELSVPRIIKILTSVLRQSCKWTSLTTDHSLMCFNRLETKRLFLLFESYRDHQHIYSIQFKKNIFLSINYLSLCRQLPSAAHCKIASRATKLQGKSRRKFSKCWRPLAALLKC